MLEDWRLANLKMLQPLHGAGWVRKPYTAYRPGWDHDHCSACNKTLAELGIEGDDVVHEGYAVTEDCEKGADYYWVCAECFGDFRDEMGWRELTI